MRLNTDRVVSLSAMLVGLGSLFIIVYLYGDRWRVSSDSVVPQAL